MVEDLLQDPERWVSGKEFGNVHGSSQLCERQLPELQTDSLDLK